MTRSLYSQLAQTHAAALEQTMASGGTTVDVDTLDRALWKALKPARALTGRTPRRHRRVATKSRARAAGVYEELLAKAEAREHLRKMEELEGKLEKELEEELDALKEAKADALTDARLNNEFLGRGFADLQARRSLHTRLLFTSSPPPHPPQFYQYLTLRTSPSYKP